MGLPPVKPPDIDPSMSVNESTSTKRRRTGDSTMTSSSTNDSLNLPSTSETVVPPTPEIKLTPKYPSSAPPPYLVIVESSEPNKRLHPMVFGGLVARSGVRGIVSGGVRADGRNKIAVTFSSPSLANAFISNETLSTNQLRAFIPSYKLYKNGIIRGVPVELNNDEILHNIEVPSSCGKVIKLRRLNRRVSTPEGSEWKPSTTVLLTFEGQTLPEHIYLFYNAIKVELYSYPCYICHQCLRYGHTKNKCTSAPKCFRCGENHVGESCPVKELPPKCANCKGDHLATDSSCPEFIRQKKIKYTMASENVSFIQAVKLTPSSKKFYSEAVTSSHKQSPTPKVKLNAPPSRPVIKPYIDREATEALLSYSNGQPTNPQNGCAIKQNNTVPRPLSFISEKNQLLQMLSQILTLVISNPNEQMITQILPSLTSIFDKFSETEYEVLNNYSSTRH